jgi:hypothetical protein
MKLFAAALASTLALAPAARAADITLKCTISPPAGTPLSTPGIPVLVYVITENTAYVVDHGDQYRVEETATLFKLTETNPTPNSIGPVTINRITGALTGKISLAFPNAFPSMKVLSFEADGNCTPAKARF